MWVELEINGLKHYLLCQLEEASMDCLLCNENESWYEKENFEQLLQRAKNCNKRINYDEATVKTTLQKGQRTNVTFLQDNENSEEYLLTLKYKVENYPFNFVWHLKKLTLLEFQAQLINKSFKVLEGFKEQNIELQSALRKKDNELYYLQICGGNPKKSDTDVVQRFDFTKFDEKYADVMAFFNILKQIEANFKEHFGSSLIIKSQIEDESGQKAEIASGSKSEQQLSSAASVQNELAIKFEVEQKTEPTFTALKVESQNKSEQTLTEAKTSRKDLKRELLYESSDDSADA